ncbi:MAG TPA: AsmA family protein, partial [Fibrobacteria bacterium]|nr:AsmA family protein [Fibrobacteria bacterium]
MKVLKRVILAGVILIMALGLGAYFAIKLAFPPQKIKDLVHKHGSAALGRDVTVGSVTIRLFPNIKLSVQEINVANGPGFSADPCIKLREVALSINVLSLIKFSPVINEIKLVQPEFLYEVDKGGRNNLEGLGGKPDTVKAIKDTAKTLESPAALALKSFVIEDGRVRYKDAKTGQEVVLNRINQVVSLDLDQRLENVITQGKLVLSEIQVNDPALGIRKGDLQVTVRHDLRVNLPAERLQVRTLELGFQDIRATVKGEATQFMTKPPKVDFSLSAPEVRLASLLKEVPPGLSPDVPKLSARGIASLDARVQGVLDSGVSPDVTARLSVKEAALSHKDLPAGVDNLNIDLGLVRDTLRLSRFAFTMGGNPVAIEALVTSLKDSVPQLQSLSVDALLDLGKLIPLLQKMSMVDKSMKASGLVAAKVTGSGPLDPKAPENLKVQGQVDLKGLSVQPPDMPQAIGADGQVKIDNDRIVQSLKVRTGESDVTVDGTVRNYLALVMPEKAKGSTAKAKLTVQSQNLNLDELLPKGKEEEVQEEAPPATAWPSLPKLDADIDVKLARTQLMGLAMTDFTSTSKLVGGVLNTALKGKVYSGSFSSSLSADLKDTTNAGIGLKLNVDKVEANDFISRLNGR